MSRRSRILCYVLAALLLLVGAFRLVSPARVLIDPLSATGTVHCLPGCRFERDPVMLLGEEMRKQAWAMPDVERRIGERMERPGSRAFLVAASLLRALPFALIFFSLAFAMWSFARRGFTSHGSSWLRRAAGAALFWSLLLPVSDVLRHKALHPVVTGSEGLNILFDLPAMLVGLLISGAAWVTILIVEEALALRAELEDYV